MESIFKKIAFVERRILKDNSGYDERTRVVVYVNRKFGQSLIEN